MSLTAKAPEGGVFEKAPEGVYIARCYELIDIGTQNVIRQTPGGVKEVDLKQVIIGWELFGDELKEDGTPFTIEQVYTNSLWKTANLFKDLNSWRGKNFTDEEIKGFDLNKVLGAYCQIQVAHNESGNNTYANVDTLMALPKGTTKPEAVNEAVAFDIDNPDVKIFNALGDYHKRKIQSAYEWKAPKGAELAEVNTPARAQSSDVVLTDIDEQLTVDDVPF